MLLRRGHGRPNKTFGDEITSDSDGSSNNASLRSLCVLPVVAPINGVVVHGLVCLNGASLRSVCVLSVVAQSNRVIVHGLVCLNGEYLI